MSNVQEPKPVELSRFKLLIGASMIAHVLGVWISITVSFLWVLGDGTFVGALIGASISIFLGAAYIAAAWFLITLPLAALTMYFGVNQNPFTTTLVGALSGALLVIAPALWSSEGLEQLSFPHFSIALMGGLIAALFSILSRMWGGRSKRKTAE